MSLKQRTIEIIIELDKRISYQYGSVKVIRDLAVSIDITKLGDKTTNNEAKIEIWGLEKILASLLTKLNLSWEKVYNNKITVSVGYDGDLFEIYYGNIVKAINTYNPDSSIVIYAQTNYANSIVQKGDISIKGTILVGDLFTSIATSIGLNVVNIKEIANKRMTDPILIGSPLDQLKKIADIIGFDFTADDKTINIVPIVSNKLGTIIELNPDTGLIGYPTFDERGIIAQSYFNKLIKVNDPIHITSSQPQAEGIWRVFEIKYKLENYGSNWNQDVHGVFLSRN